MKKLVLFLTATFLFFQTLTSQTLVSSDFLGHKTIQDLLQFDSPMLNGADFYRITYETSALDGSTTVVSGLLAVPDDLTKRYPRMVYQHGTSGDDMDVPSSLNPESNIALALCGKGYVVCAPDYLGLGVNAGLHPYVHAESEAWVAVDMLRAADQFLEENEVEVNGQMFVTGYSQGGHSAMALHRMMEMELPDEFTVTAAAPMSGPYSVSGAMRDLLFSEAEYSKPGYLLYTLVSYQEVYGDLYASIADAVKEPYQQLVTDFAADVISLAEMDAGLADLLNQNEGGTIVGKAFKDDYVQAILDDPGHPANVAMKANDVYDWAPAAPTRIYYCEADEQVPFENSTLAETTMNANGAADVEAINVNSFIGHAFCAFFAPGEAADFFVQYQLIEDLPMTAAFEAAGSSLEFYPNPVADRAYIKNFPAEGIARVFDMSGKLLFSQNIHSGDNALNVSALPKGVHLLEVLSDGYFWKEKLVKK